MELSEDTYNRLWSFLIEQFDCSIEEAQEMLQTFRVRFICNEEISKSIPLQAAFLTAVNSATRAFLGGVFFDIPSDIPCLLPWPDKSTLNDIAISFGALRTEQAMPDILTLSFGSPGNIDENIVQVVADDWTGGVLVDGNSSPFDSKGNIPLGGIFAGGLAVELAFLKTSKAQPDALNRSTGISLWEPGANWLTAGMPKQTNTVLPEELWVLGLGHLGQAYLWAIGLLPYESPDAVNIYLQDYDRIALANVSAGLLCSKEDINRYKTRVSSEWLERRKFKTTIVERPFDINTEAGEKEPKIALCGFDNAESRMLLENANFQFVVEAGLGDSSNNFDKILMHTFPSKKHSAEDIWKDAKENAARKEKLAERIGRNIKTVCGVQADILAGKAISVSFVGACAAALVIAEVIKAYNFGMKSDLIALQLRALKNKQVFNSEHKYSTELGTTKYGYALCLVAETDVTN